MTQNQKSYGKWRTKRNVPVAWRVTPAFGVEMVLNHLKTSLEDSLKQVVNLKARLPYVIFHEEQNARVIKYYRNTQKYMFSCLNFIYYKIDYIKKLTNCSLQ